MALAMKKQRNCFYTIKDDCLGPLVESQHSRTKEQHKLLHSLKDLHQQLHNPRAF